MAKSTTSSKRAGLTSQKKRQQTLPFVSARPIKKSRNSTSNKNAVGLAPIFQQSANAKARAASSTSVKPTHQQFTAKKADSGSPNEITAEKTNRTALASLDSNRLHLKSPSSILPSNRKSSVFDDADDTKGPALDLMGNAVCNFDSPIVDEKALKATAPPLGSLEPEETETSPETEKDVSMDGPLKSEEVAEIAWADDRKKEIIEVVSYSSFQ